MTVLAVAAHIGAIIACWLSPGGRSALFLLNGLIACAVLVRAASRAKYIVAASDWPYLGLVAFEILVLAVAVFALKGQRIAAITSYVAFGLHTLAAIAAAVYAFAFKMRLM